MRPQLLAFVLIAVALPAGSAAAQDAATLAPFGESAPAPGWTVTPAAGVAQTWDDNVLVEGRGSNVSSDFVSVFTPRASLDYNGPRSTFSAAYSGAFELYRQFSGLNSYGQFETASAHHKVTSRTSFFVQQQFSMTPTTDLPLLIGVPFVRLGARVADGKVGLDHAFTKRTSIEASYDYQWISFDRDPALGEVLIGGHGHTAAASIRHQVSKTTTLLANYEIQHAAVVDGSTFTVQNSRAGAEHRFSPSFLVFAEAGVAHLGTSKLGAARTSPSIRAGAAQRFGRVAVSGTYSREFVPAFGAGDTLQSNDIGGHVRTELSRRLYAEGSADWRHDSPIAGLPNTFGEVPLHSLWYSALVGYTASPWLRIEGFFNATHQDATRPGGQLDRERIGIQVTTLKPMRVR